MRMEWIETEGKPAAAAECRALTVIGPASQGGRAVRPASAAFLAQLLAVKADLPQTRERRRAEPDEAVHCYAHAMTPLPPRAGRMVSRAM
jgi:hypothetical protein